MTIFKLALLALAQSSVSFAACYVDQDIESLCKTGTNSAVILWATNLQARNTLFQSDDVQKSQKGCEAFARLVKTECQPDRPVTALYYDDSHLYKAESIFMDVSRWMNTEAGLPQTFVTYFRAVPIVDSIKTIPTIPTKPNNSPIPYTPTRKRQMER